MAMNNIDEMMILKAAQRLMGGYQPGSFAGQKFSSSEAEARAIRDMLTAISAEEHIDLDEIRDTVRTAGVVGGYRKGGVRVPIIDKLDNERMRSARARKLSEIRRDFQPGPERNMSRDAVKDAEHKGLSENKMFNNKTSRLFQASASSPHAIEPRGERLGSMEELVKMRRGKGMLPLLLLSLLGVGGLGLAGAAGGRGDEA